MAEHQFAIDFSDQLAGQAAGGQPAGMARITVKVPGSHWGGVLFSATDLALC